METEQEKKDIVPEQSETKVEKVEEKKAAPAKEGKKWDCKLTEVCNKNRTAIAAVVLVILVAGSFAFAKYSKRNELKPEEAKTKVEKFINENLLQPGTTATIKDIVVEGDLYKVTVVVGTQEVVGYVTKDGKKFFPQTIEMDKKPGADANSQAAAPEKTEAEQKTDVPTVDLFVMSYCPYGLQMERGFLPAAEALGNKIKFNLKFVDYTLHGPKEVTENVNQYCIEKIQPTKLGSYLKCFWKNSAGTSAACMKTAGINAAQVATCVSETNKQFNPTEKAMGLNKDETIKFDVQGSPTLVVNGTTVASGRDSASVLKAICSGFTTQPKECQAKLSTVSPVAGFDDQAAAAASAGGAAAPATGACN